MRKKFCYHLTGKLSSLVKLQVNGQKSNPPRHLQTLLSMNSIALKDVKSFEKAKWVVRFWWFKSSFLKACLSSFVCVYSSGQK